MNIKPGFSLIKILIIILVIAALGVGGYFAYGRFIAPMLNPYNKLIPADLQAYAIGANADTFAILNIDSELSAFIKENPDLKNPATITGAILISKTSSKSGQMIIGFESIDAADSFRASTETSMPTSGPFPIRFEQKEKIVIITVNPDKLDLTGKLADNPTMKELNQNMLDSQLIVYGNIQNLTESFLAEALKSPVGKDVYLFPPLIEKASIAHAAMINPVDVPENIADTTGGDGNLNSLINTYAPAALLKNLQLYGRIKNQKLDLKININLLTKEEHLSSAFQKQIAALMEQKPDGSYDSAISTINQGIALANLFKGSIEQKIGNNFKINISFNNPQIDISITGDITPAVKTMIKEGVDAALKTPVKARDAARLSNVNSITSAVEAYLLNQDEDTTYPQTSSCLNQISELKPYFQGQKFPESPTENQVFDDIDCGKSYYYQSFGDKGYAIWAKVENTENGNTDLTPLTVIQTIEAGKKIPVQNGGEYYVFSPILLERSQSDQFVKIAEPATQETAAPDDTTTTTTILTQETIVKPKVKRVTTSST